MFILLILLNILIVLFLAVYPFSFLITMIPIQMKMSKLMKNLSSELKIFDEKLFEQSTTEYKMINTREINSTIFFSSYEKYPENIKCLIIEGKRMFYQILILISLFFLMFIVYGLVHIVR